MARVRRCTDCGTELVPCDQHGRPEKNGGGDFLVCPRAAGDFERAEGTGVYYRRPGARHREVRIEVPGDSRKARKAAAKRAQLDLLEPGAGARME